MDHYLRTMCTKWLFIIVLAVSLHGGPSLGSYCNVGNNITHSLHGQDVTFNWSSSEAPLASRWRKNNIVMMGRIGNDDVLYENGFTADKVWPIDYTAFTLARASTNDNDLYSCDHFAVNGSHHFALVAKSQLQVHVVSVDDLLPNLLLNDTELTSEVSVESRNEQTLSSSAPMNDPACVNVLINVVGLDHSECSHLSSAVCSLVLDRDSMLHRDTVNVSVTLFHPLVGTQTITKMLYTHATPAVTNDLPENFNISTEGNLDISCSFSARPSASVMWLYTNGSALPGDIYSITEFISSDALKIISSRLQWIHTADHTARIGQGGLIRCISGNDHGIVASSVMDLNVQYGAIDIGINSTDNEFCFIEGDIFTPLACVANCNPACKYSWHWANDTLVAMGNTLTFEPFNRMYHGIFHCKATNGVDSDGSNFTVTIDVFYGPSIHSFAVSYPYDHISQHDDVILTCHTDSRPVPVITLIRPSGDTLVSSSTSNTLEHRLIDIDCLDSGSYRCEAYNSHTENTSYMTKSVVVHCPPRVHTSSPTDVSASEGDTVNLTLTAIGFPKPEFSWYFNDKEFSGPSVTPRLTSEPDVYSSSSLIVHNVSLEDFGNYSVEAANEEGSLNVNFFLISVGTPRTPSLLRVYHSNAISITMQWISGWNRGGDQVFTLIYRRSDRDDSYTNITDIRDPGECETVTAKVVGLLPDSSYDFMVLATNQFGSAQTEVTSASSEAAPLLDADGSLSVTVSGSIASIEWSLGCYTGPITHVDINSCDLSSTICFITIFLNITSTVEVAVPEAGSSYTFVFSVYDGEDLLLNVNHVIRIDKGQSTGLIVGVVVAVVLLCALVAIIGVIVRNTRPAKDDDRTQSHIRNNDMRHFNPDEKYENSSAPEWDIGIPASMNMQPDSSPYEQIEASVEMNITSPSVYEHPQTLQSVAVSTVYETLHNGNTVSTEAVGQQDILEHPEYANMN